VRVTTAAATAIRLASLLPPDESVVAVDQLVATGATELAEARMLASSTRGAGSARARSAVVRADGLAASPQETRLRLLIAGSRLPAPVAQFAVRLDGRVIARVDFAWPGHKVALEYDGMWHAAPGQFAKDRRRLNDLTAAGWRVILVTAVDLGREAELFARLEAALLS
jgi:very-short-patch-repair endonuclease